MTLREFLRNIADAIRKKKGTTKAINAKNFANEILSIEGGECTKNHVVESNTFPVGLKNIEYGTVYKSNKMEVCVVIMFNGTRLTLHYAIFNNSGKFPLELKYYIVDDLPDSPYISDMSTFTSVSVYIYNDVPYIYGDLGTGNNSWIKISDLINRLLSTTLTDKGWIYWIPSITDDGVYILYKHYIRPIYGVEDIGHEFYEYVNYQGAKLFYFNGGETETEEGLGLMDYFDGVDAVSVALGNNELTRRRYRIVETEEEIKTKVYDVPYIIRSTNQIITYTGENSYSTGVITAVNDVSEITSPGYYMIYKEPGVWVNVADGTWLYD